MTNADLFAAVQRWATANYGLTAEQVSIRLRGLTDPVALPVFVLPATIAPQTTSEDERGPAIRPCIRDILFTLREVGRPLSRTRLLEEMGKRGMEWSETTVATYLGKLMEDGTLENPEDARPRGYRLPTEG